MTISPVKTRLIRAKALELRSKICAMNPYLRDFLFWMCPQCPRSHMLCTVFVLGYRSPESWRSPKIQYTSQRGPHNKLGIQIKEKGCLEFHPNSLKLKPLVTIPCIGLASLPSGGCHTRDRILCTKNITPIPAPAILSK